MAVPLVTARKNPHTAAAWLAVVFAFPVLGLILYWFIGLERLPQRRIRRRRGAHSTRGELLARQRPYVARPDADPRERDMLALAQTLGDFPLVAGNAVELHDGAARILPRLLADIEAASDHVHMCFYIYADDATGVAVGEALARAAERGVVCRLLVDHAGSAGFLRRLAPALRARGVDVRAGLPVSLPRLLLARIDLRNHRKVVVIDGQVAWTGSFNVVDPSYGHADLRWVDAMLRLGGPVVDQLQDVFLEDWLQEVPTEIDDARYHPPPQTPGHVRVQTVPSGPTEPTEAFVRLIVGALYNARERVVLTTPYLIPDAPVLLALQMAAARGVQVDLVVPRRSDHRVVGLAGRAYYDELLEAGVRIHRYEAGILHTKSLTVDDVFAVFGSGNLDVRSFYLNYEVNLLLPGAEVTRLVRDLQLTYMAAASPLDPASWRRRPLAVRLAQNAAKLLSPIL